LTSPISQIQPKSDAVPFEPQGDNSQGFLSELGRVEDLDEILSLNQDFIHYRLDQKIFELAKNFQS
jgi:hypothetical protein